MFSSQGVIVHVLGSGKSSLVGLLVSLARIPDGFDVFLGDGVEVFTDCKDVSNDCSL